MGALSKVPRKPPDPFAVLRGHRSDVTAVAFLGTPGTVLSGDAEGELKLWDPVTLRPFSSSRAHSAGAGVIGIGVLSRRDDFFLSQGRDGTVKAWQLQEGGLPREPLLCIQTGSYNFCKLSALDRPLPRLPEPQAVHSSGTHPNIGVEIEASCREQLPDSQPVEHECRANAVNDANQDESLTVPSGTSLCEYEEGGGAAPVAADMPSRELVAIAGKDPSVVEVWDVKSGKAVVHFKQPAAGSTSVAAPVANVAGPPAGMCMSVKLFEASGSDNLIGALGGYEDGSVMGWELRMPGAPVFHKRLHAEPVMSVAVASDGVSGLSGSADDKIAFFSTDLSKGDVNVVKEVTAGRPGISDIAVRPDDRIVATAGWDNKVRIFDYKRQRPLAVLGYHSAAVTAVAFSLDNQWLASASRDATVALWSIYSPQEA